MTSLYIRCNHLTNKAKHLVNLHFQMLKKIMAYMLLGILVALITSTAWADHASCIAACLQTLHDGMVIALAVYAAAIAICILTGIFFPGWGILCALSASAALAATVAAL